MPSKTHLLIGLLLLASLAISKAGTVVTLGNAPEAQGTLALTPTSIQVQGTPAIEIKLSDVFEANFNDAPFQLNYFSGRTDTSQTLPAGWKAQDIGTVTVPGAVAYAAGTFTLTPAEWDSSEDGGPGEHCFVVGMPWTGDGQWTVRVKDLGGEGFVRTGFMLRAITVPLATNIGMATWDNNNALMFARNPRGTWGSLFEEHDYPQWFRMTRRGDSISFEFSHDGQVWASVGQSTQEMTKAIWAGFFVNSHPGKGGQKITMDQVLFTPAPGRLMSTGILLRSGSFLAGYFSPLDFDKDKPVGRYPRNGKILEISASQTAAAIYHPVALKAITDVGAQVGILMRNNDFMSGNFEAINAGGVRLNSIEFGTQSYDRDDVVACTLNPLAAKPADYEIRLKDGSDIRARGFRVEKDQVMIDEISGLAIPAAMSEIAQIRAGSARVENLRDLEWKAAPAMPLEKPAGGLPPEMQCWMGPNQEQIMALPLDTRLDFPLTGKFRALALRVALSPDAPAQAEGRLRILADGKEVAHTPPFKAGEQPRFVQVALPESPKILSIIVDSTSGGIRLLLIDPFVVRSPTP